MGVPMNFCKISFFYPSTPSMRKGHDGENGKDGMENNGENSGPLTSLPVDRLAATDFNADVHAKKKEPHKGLPTH